MTRGWVVRRGESAELAEVDRFLHGGDQAGAGDVLIDVSHSSINYKDALALRGQPGVARVSPLVPGIDLVGTVAESADRRWRPGAAVLVNGWGLGETHHGGLAERARVDGSWLVRIPGGISPERAAAIGTAGFTAELAVQAVADRPAGNVLVTGATGGVGSIATALLAARGARVVAATGRLAERDYLTGLGAADVLDRRELEESGKPLQSQRWAAAVDSVGGVPLANILAQTVYGGPVAACGLAADASLPATVMPFILRGVRLLGINSVRCPEDRRIAAWAGLAATLDLRLLDSITTTVPLADAAQAAEDLLAGRLRGRVVVDVRA
ncbi:MDR family oxidoreductase [Lysobacter korlensis]|uniref:MDR family oxidoreductase n=1 Tax=Lysobacter korlensis TaxID=553636 RepID=A0ABV6RTC8_9GAMM